MALLDPEMPLRMASVRSLTTVNLAVMTRNKFESLSILYPQFKENIAKMVR
jgi:CRP-like cAMP-binding protein